MITDSMFFLKPSLSGAINTTEEEEGRVSYLIFNNLQQCLLSSPWLCPGNANDKNFEVYKRCFNNKILDLQPKGHQIDSAKGPGLMQKLEGE